MHFFIESIKKTDTVSKITVQILFKNTYYLLQ